MRNLFIIISLLILSCAGPVRVIRPSQYMSDTRREEVVLDLMHRANFQDSEKRLWTGDYQHDMYVSIFMYLVLDTIK